MRASSKLIVRSCESALATTARIASAISRIDRFAEGSGIVCAAAGGSGLASGIDMANMITAAASKITFFIGSSVGSMNRFMGWSQIGVECLRYGMRRMFGRIGL